MKAIEIKCPICQSDAGEMCKSSDIVLHGVTVYRDLYHRSRIIKAKRMKS